MLHGCAWLALQRAAAAANLPSQAAPILFLPHQGGSMGLNEPIPVHLASYSELFPHFSRYSAPRASSGLPRRVGDAAAALGFKANSNAKVVRELALADGGGLTVLAPAGLALMQSDLAAQRSALLARPAEAAGGAAAAAAASASDGGSSAEPIVFHHGFRPGQLMASNSLTQLERLLLVRWPVGGGWVGAGSCGLVHARRWLRAAAAHAQPCPARSPPGTHSPFPPRFAPAEPLPPPGAAGDAPAQQRRGLCSVVQVRGGAGVL